MLMTWTMISQKISEQSFPKTASSSIFSDLGIRPRAYFNDTTALLGEYPHDGLFNLVVYQACKLENKQPQSFLLSQIPLVLRQLHSA